MIYGVELVQFCLRENAERRFTVALAFHIPVVVSGLISQYVFAESIKPALFAIVAGDSFHLLPPPFCGGCGGSVPFRQHDTRQALCYPLNATFSKCFEKVFSGLAVLQKATKNARQVATDLLGADMFQYNYYLHGIVHIYSRAAPVGELCFF